VREKPNKNNFLFVFPNESTFGEAKGTNKREQYKINKDLFLFSNRRSSEGHQVYLNGRVVTEENEVNESTFGEAKSTIKVRGLRGLRGLFL
jgi:hypothetical protein